MHPAAVCPSWMKLRLMQHLSHPHLVGCFDAFLFRDEDLCIVMKRFDDGRGEGHVLVCADRAGAPLPAFPQHHPPRPQGRQRLRRRAAADAGGVYTDDLCRLLVRLLDVNPALRPNIDDVLLSPFVLRHARQYAASPVLHQLLDLEAATRPNMVAQMAALHLAPPTDAIVGDAADVRAAAARRVACEPRPWAESRR